MDSNARQITSGTPLASAANKVEILRDQDEAYLQRHYPFYFAYNAGLSKLQISFKSPVARTWPLYFGYTQLMFWALRDDSKPFSDLTYNPELFYRQKLVGWGLVKSIDLGILNHTSNGRDGSESRSFDRAHLKLNFEKEFSRWIMSFHVQWSVLYDIEDGNSDIRDYISPLAVGVSTVQLFDSWVDKSELALQLIPGGRKGQEISSGGYQASWSFRLGGLDVVPAFYLQYYHGYAETLLNYHSRVDVFRVGFIF